MEDLDLKEVLRMFWNKKIQIIIIVTIFILIGIVYSLKPIKPLYSASTTLVLVVSGDEEDGVITEDIILNTRLISTYSELIKSKSVIREVMDNLEIDKSEEEDIKSGISVISVVDTDVIKINVINEDPEKAADVANELADVFLEKIAKEIYNIKNIKIVDEAEVDDSPVNLSNNKNVFKFAFVGIVLSFIYVVAANLLDTTIKSIEEIERKYNVKVLAAVPKFKIKKQKGGKN